MTEILEMETEDGFARGEMCRSEDLTVWKEEPGDCRIKVESRISR